MIPIKMKCGLRKSFWVHFNLCKYMWSKCKTAVSDRLSEITEGVNTAAELSGWKPFREITASESLFYLKLCTLTILSCYWLEEICIIK